jgi:hypothetical protein
LPLSVTPPGPFRVRLTSNVHGVRPLRKSDKTNQLEQQPNAASTFEHGEQAAWPSPVESSLQRRPDLLVDDQIREMVEVGLLAIDDDQAGDRLLRQSWEPRGRIDFE